MVFIIRSNLVPVYFPEDIEILDAMKYTWVDNHVNVYGDHVSVIAEIDGAHRFEVAEIYTMHDYGSEFLDRKHYRHRSYRSVQEFAQDMASIIRDIRETGYKVFFRLRIKRFNYVGHLVSFDEWRVWLDNDEQATALISYLGVMQ